MPLTLSTSASEGREPRVSHGCTHPSHASPTASLGRGTEQGSVSVCLAACPLHCAYQSTLLHPAQGAAGPPLARQGPGLVSLVLSQSVNGAPGLWAFTKR